jgi:polyisoprenoid-binding protein YceI
MSIPRKIVVGVVLGVALLGAGVWWFLRDDAPPEVNLADAVSQVEGGGSTDGSAATGSGTVDTIDGTWVVDASSGDFDFDDATGTFAGFRIKEELAGIGSTTAVGRTGDVTGTVEISDNTLRSASFEVNVTTITTNDGRRDNQVQRALATGTNPTATFTLTQPLPLDPEAIDGEPLSVTAVGDLTIAGVTRSVEFPLEAQLVGGTVVVVGSIDIVFSDYGVSVPDSQIVLSVADNGTLELQVLLVKP